MTQPLEDAVWQALRTVTFPGMSRDVVSFGFVIIALTRLDMPRPTEASGESLAASLKAGLVHVWKKDLAVHILRSSASGRYMYAIGNREAATYLSGVNTKLVLIASFVMCSLSAAIAGLLLSGYSGRAYQAMGDEYLLPSIAAVVLGGTHILGGKGRYAGTAIGAVLIVLLQSVLSVMQMPEAGRQVIYGAVIILMLLVYGRGERVQS